MNPPNSNVSDKNTISSILDYLVDNVEMIRHRMTRGSMKPADGYEHNQRLKEEAEAALTAYFLELVGEDKKFTIISEDDDYEGANWEREVMQIENRVRQEIRNKLKTGQNQTN